MPRRTDAYTKLKRYKESSNLVQVSNKNHGLDIWLARLSHIAQFGLFLFTVLISYFTVLPLYQKAVLEEAVAKKEVELAALNKSLEEAYDKLRDYSIRDFAMAAMPDCGGLFVGIDRTGKPLPDKNKAEIIFEIDVPSCLNKLSKDLKSLKQLSSRDRAIFENNLDKISSEISKQKEYSIKAYHAVPSKIKDSDWHMLPSDSYMVRMELFIEKLNGGQPNIESRRKILLQHEQNQVLNSYTKFISDRINELRDIKWNAKDATQ
jgi:hypothetical protein